jgi:hypothetical protein
VLVHVFIVLGRLAAVTPCVAVPHLDVSLTATAAITRPLVNPSPIWEWIGEKSVRQHAGQLAPVFQ